MRNKFKLLTYLKLLFEYVFKYKKIKLVILDKIVKESNYKDKFDLFLHKKKQELIEKKYGKEFLLNLRMFDILNLKI
jgi:hypothetical protein